MALVAYDDSDTSDLDDDTNEIFSNTNTTKIEELIITEPVQSNDNETPILLNQLPQPKKSVIVEEDDEFLHKKETATIFKPKAKIMVPSLSDFKDVETGTPIKPKLTNGKKSGLLSILPQPKNASTVSVKSLIPQVVSQKPKTDTAKKKEQLPAPLKTPAVKSLAKDYSDESDNDDENQNDFFSINKKIEIPANDLPLDIESEPKSGSLHNTHKTSPRSIESYFKKSDEINGESTLESAKVSNAAEHYRSESGSSHENSNRTQNATYDDGVVLDDEAILKLCGARGKRKREDIQIVDVNQQEVLADAREWLLKGLMDDTTKRVSSSKRKGNEPTSQQKRKHQITYLAHQAKANEAELQNQWANSRMNKRKTQSKYGF